MAHSYRELFVWQRAKAFAVKLYRVTASFPKSETYGLTSQLRRAAVSVASNIAEGQGRLTAGEFRHFLGQARGSALEVATQIAIAEDLGYLNQEGSSLVREADAIVGLINRLLVLCQSAVPSQSAELQI